MALSTASAAATAAAAAHRTISIPTRIVTIPERTWRTMATEHSERIRKLLAPGLLPPPPSSSSSARRRRQGPHVTVDAWTALDRYHPVYNFLIEYYGLKGAKGPRRLGRWSPDLGLLAEAEAANSDEENEEGNYGKWKKNGGELRWEVRNVEVHVPTGKGAVDLEKSNHDGEAMEGAMAEATSATCSGILLENASEDDLGTTLHLKGATFIPPQQQRGGGGGDGGSGGILYSPALYYQTHPQFSSTTVASDRHSQLIKAAPPFQWYRSILRTTSTSTPILHCHGLHEWAMQYHPPNAPPPPSSKYQSHLNLRVSRQTINRAVERRGIHCTHVDALRFFAPAAAPLNHHGAKLERTDQLRLEQKGCVHAHMDLLKIATRLSPFVDATLVGDALELALEARRLDVEASPYDVTPYGLGAVPVETKEGRAEYRRRQEELMVTSDPVRRKLLGAYDAFLGLAFDASVLDGAERSPARERFAVAEPGGEPWRRNLI